MGIDDNDDLPTSDAAVTSVMVVVPCVGVALIKFEFDEGLVMPLVLLLLFEAVDAPAAEEVPGLFGG